MFPYSTQPFSSIARANFAAFLNVSGRFASGIQQLTELNIQTVKTVIEESNSLLRAGEQASAGDVLGWQSVMLAQFPEKAASYSKHFISIITSTEADIIKEARSQYERNGIEIKGAVQQAAEDAQSATEEQGAILSDATRAVTNQMAESTASSAGVILDASGELANKAAETGEQMTDIAETATSKARSSSKR